LPRGALFSFRSPLALAQARGYGAMAKLLRRAGAR